MTYNLIFENGFDALIETTIFEDDRKLSIRVSQITAIGLKDNGRTMMLFNNGKFVEVKESREEILESINRLQKIYSGGSLE